MKNYIKYISLVIYIYIITLPVITADLGLKTLNHLPDALIGIVLLLFLIQLISDIDKRNKLRTDVIDFFRNSNSILMFCVFILMAISLTYSANKVISISETIRFGSYIFLYFIIKYVINNKKFEDNVIGIYILVCTAISIFGILQYFTRLGLNPSFTGNYGIYGSLKLTSTLDNPNSYGAFLILAFFPILVIAINQNTIRRKVVYGFIDLLILINMFLTFSRNAWLGLIIGCLVLIIFYNWKFIFLFIIGGGVSLFVPQILHKIKDIVDPAQDISRLKIWENGIRIIKDHPILGVGNGNFINYSSTYIKKYPELKYSDHTSYPSHNSYIKIQSELGIFGSIFFIGLLVNSVMNIYKYVKCSLDKLGKNFYTGFFASVLAFYLMNLSDNLLFVPKVSAFFWIFIAIVDTKLYRDRQIDFTKES